MGAAEAVIRINSLEIKPADFIEDWGFAEWYVGTRGGCSDHAAIISGKPGTILHITAFPTSVEDAALPPGHSFVLANSNIEAKKQAGARDVFNSRVAAYIFGLMMIRENFPQYADKLHRVFRSHAEPEQGYRLRQICLYGIAECIRAEMVPKCLRTGDMKTFGELMSASHNGDRVTKVVDGQRIPTDNTYLAQRIDALISDLESGDKRRMDQARLWRQGGGYNVSLPEDIALATPGCLGAGLVGAGMGGSIVAVVEDKHAQLYRPRNLPPGAEIITPVGGLCTMDV